MQFLKMAMTGVFAFALVLTTSTAWAGNGDDFDFDRPDLMDTAEPGDEEDGQIGNWVGFESDNNADNQMAMTYSVAYGGYSTQLGDYDAYRVEFQTTWTQAPTGYIYDTWTWLPTYGGYGTKYYYTWDAEGEYTITYTDTWWTYYNYDSDFTFAELRWVLAQPDKVQVNHKRKKVRQKDYVGWVAIIEDHVGESERVARDWESDISELIYYGSIAGCRGKAKVKDTTPDPIRADADAENCADQAKWKIRCTQTLRDVLLQLQKPGPPRRGGGDTMTEATADRLLALLGLTGTETVIRGVDTGHTCDPADDDRDDQFFLP